MVRTCCRQLGINFWDTLGHSVIFCVPPGRTWFLYILVLNVRLLGLTGLSIFSFSVFHLCSLGDVSDISMSRLEYMRSSASYRP